MKPTFGRVPVWPQTNYHASTVHIGPLTRSVADAALMLETLAGPDPRDPTTALAGDARNRFMPSAGTSVGEACLGYSFDLEYGVVADEVRRAFARTIESLAAEGLRVRPHRELWPDPGNAQQIRWNSAMAALFEDYLSTSPSDFEPELAELIEHGTRLTAMNVARDYLLERGALVDSVNKIFESIDYLITPSMPLTAWSLDEDPREVDGSALPGGGSLSRAYLLFPFNLTGHPAISIPTELDADGLPIGVQVIGRLGDDAGVLRVAAVVERIVGAGARLPVGGLP
jgi:Asp-tRNA(Asn)/Glu-tRNA(Gln) amidotransferase A subunit family amidase